MCVCVAFIDCPLVLLLDESDCQHTWTVNPLGIRVQKNPFFIAQPRYFFGFYLVLLGFLDVQCQGLSM